MSKESKYSVLMSVYYKEKPEWLQYALESIINQTIMPNEIVLVEDGNLTSDLYNVIDKFNLKYPNLFNIIKLKKNVGLGLALREGILKCKNELIARMDSDDYSTPDRCEKLLSIFDKDETYECVGSLEAEFEHTINDVVSVHKVPESSEEIERFMRRRCALLHPTVMFKRSSVIKAGNYRSVILYEDYDLFMRMVCENHCKCYNIQESLYYIRVNSDFYKRRGGIKYMKTVLKFKNMQRKKGYMSLFDFIVSAGGQAIVCLMPNKMRRWFYLRFLR